MVMVIGLDEQFLPPSGLQAMPKDIESTMHAPWWRGLLWSRLIVAEAQALLCECLKI